MDRRLITTLICGLVTGLALALTVQAQQEMPAPAHDAATKSINLEHDTVQTSAEHHYNSPAERAHDDLIVTEVNASIAGEGISNGYPVEVDCDHGKVQLSGVVASADDAKRATELAQTVQGVAAVNSQLTWR